MVLLSRAPCLPSAERCGRAASQVLRKRTNWCFERGMPVNLLGSTAAPGGAKASPRLLTNRASGCKTLGSIKTRGCVGRVHRRASRRLEYRCGALVGLGALDRRSTFGTFARPAARRQDASARSSCPCRALRPALPRLRPRAGRRRAERERHHQCLKSCWAVLFAPRKRRAVARLPHRAPPATPCPRRPPSRRAPRPPSASSASGPRRPQNPR